MKRWMGVVALLGLTCGLIMSLRDSSAQGRGKAEQVVANERVRVMRLTAVAGLEEEMHLTPQDVIAIQTEPGQVEMQIGGEVTKGAPGRVWYLPKTIEHALYNRGPNPVVMLVVMLANEEEAGSQAAGREGRTNAEARPANALINNARVTVMGVPAPVGMRQDMHKSAQDMLAIQSTPGEIEVAVGSQRTPGRQWSVWYLPKTLEHAVFNMGSTPVDMTVITLK